MPQVNKKTTTTKFKTIRRRNHFILEQREIVQGFKEVLIANFDVLM
jgi:hypothetical protein